jgi:hypothetical protein
MKSDKSLKIIFVAIAIGIWVIILQNAGVIPTAQNVKVVNKVGVQGYVSVGGSVDVGNTVNVKVR